MKLRPAVIELVVGDMATTLAFYRHLGLDIPASCDGESHVGVDLGGLQLAFDTQDIIKGMDPSWTPPQGGHRMALAFDCVTPDAVDDAFASIVDAGYEGHLKPWDAFWGMRYAVVNDPDGNPVDLLAPLAS